MRGSARTFSASIRDLLERRPSRGGRDPSPSLTAATVNSKAASAGRRHSSSRSSTEQTAIAIAAAADLVGESALSGGGDVSRKTAGEDFGAMLERKPGAYILDR